MVVIHIKENVRSVRSKIGMGSEYNGPWRLLMAKAQETCIELYGPISPGQLDNAVPAVRAIKQYFTNHKDPKDDETRQTIIDNLEVDGMGAWLVHLALKRNYDKHKKDQQGTPVDDVPDQGA